MKTLLPLALLLFATPAVAQKLPEQDQIQCMANTIWGEARSEDIDGMIAVGFVIQNRLDAGDAETLCDVVHQKRGRVCQFDFYCQRQPALTRKEMVFLAATRYVAESIVTGVLHDPTKGARWYFKGSTPLWLVPFIKTGEMVSAGQIGAHVFIKINPDKVRVSYKY